MGTRREAAVARGGGGRISGVAAEGEGGVGWGVVLCAALVYAMRLCCAVFRCALLCCPVWFHLSVLCEILQCRGFSVVYFVFV